MITWLTAKIRWIFILAALGGPFALLGGLWDRAHTNDVLASGLETSAIIEGGSRRSSSRRGEQFVLTLAWTDPKGQKRRVQNYYISDDFAAKIVGRAPQFGGSDSSSKPAYHLLRDSVRIRYVADKPHLPIILEDAAYRQRADHEKIMISIIFSLIGLVGAGIYLVRRRRSAQVA